MSAGRSPTVAVVENDSALLKAIGRLLYASGYKSALFNSAEDYLNRSDASADDCLVLDINLGSMSGFDLHKNLCARGVLPPIVFITGRCDIPSIGQAMDCGCVAYLNKPFEPGLLLKAVRTAVQTH